MGTGPSERYKEAVAESSLTAQARANTERAASSKRRRSVSAPPSPNIGYEADTTRTLRPRRNSRDSPSKAGSSSSEVSISEGSEEGDETDSSELCEKFPTLLWRDST